MVAKGITRTPLVGADLRESTGISNYSSTGSTATPSAFLYNLQQQTYNNASIHVPGGVAVGAAAYHGIGHSLIETGVIANASKVDLGAQFGVEPGQG